MVLHVYRFSYDRVLLNNTDCARNVVLHYYLCNKYTRDIFLIQLGYRINPNQVYFLGGIRSCVTVTLWTDSLPSYHRRQHEVRAPVVKRESERCEIQIITSFSSRVGLEPAPPDKEWERERAKRVWERERERCFFVPGGTWTCDPWQRGRTC
jgi:hypothetical protein